MPTWLRRGLPSLSYIAGKANVMRTCRNAAIPTCCDAAQQIDPLQTIGYGGSAGAFCDFFMLIAAADG
jgi:hypothetical protein